MYQPTPFTEQDIESLRDVRIGCALANGLNFIDEVRRRLNEDKEPPFKPSSNALATMTGGLHYGFYLKPVNGVCSWLGFSICGWLSSGACSLGFQMWYANEKQEPPFLGEDEVVQWDSGAWLTLPLTTDDVPILIEKTLEFLRVWRGRIDAL